MLEWAWRKKFDENRLIFLSIFILFIIAVIVGIWFKFKQLSFVSQDLFHNYPIPSWILPISTIFLIEIIVWIVWGIFSNQLFHQSKKWTIMHADGFSFLSLLFLLTNISPRIILLFFLLLKAGILIYLYFKKKIIFKIIPGIIKDFAAFIVIFTLLFCFNTLLSPTSWYNPLLTYKPESPGGIVPVSTPLYKSQYVNPKLYNFSGFDPAYWGSGNNNPTSLSSNLVAWLSFLLDMPSIDSAAFHRLILGILFFFFLMGSFGFYLYLSKALNLVYPIALLGGILYTFSNHFFALEFNYEYPSFLTPYLVLPYGLLFLHLAFRKTNFVYASISGLVLALPFYILAPHPDATIHCMLFFCAYAIYKTLFSRESKPFNFAVKICLVSAGAFIACSIGYLMPIFGKLLTGELIVFGHQQGKAFSYGLSENFRVVFPLLISLWFFLFWALYCLIFYKRIPPKPKEFYFFLISILILLVIFYFGTDSRFNLWLIYRLKFINFLVEQRALVYVHLLILLAGMIGMNAIYKASKLNLKPLLISFVLFNGIFLIFVYFSSSYWVKFQPSDFAHSFPYLVNPQIISFLKSDAITSMAITLALLNIIVLVLTFFLLKWENWKTKSISLLCRNDFLVPSFLVFLASIPLIIAYPSYPQFQTGRLINNPLDCKPYITLQTLLTNFEGLNQDEANIDLIKQRLVEYEKDRQIFFLDSNDAEIQIYQHGLASYGVVSAASLGEDEVIQFAHNGFRDIDAFYLQDKNCSVDKIVIDSALPIWRIAAYNDAAIFRTIGLPPSRILFATQSDNALGIAEGRLINNSNTAVDARLLSTYPPINALYLIPGFNFTQIPKYGGYGYYARPWNLMAGQALNSESRKLLDISGIDYFVVRNEDYLHERSNAPEWQFEWSSQELEYGQHTLRLQPIFSRGKTVAIDAIAVESSRVSTGNSTITLFDDTSPEIEYGPLWSSVNDDVESIGRTLKMTGNPKSDLVFNFVGTRVKIIYPIHPSSAEMDVYIDNELITRLDITQGSKMDWSDLEKIQYQVPEEINPDFTVLKNQRSFGLGYFARSVRVIDSSLFNTFIAKYQPPFYYSKPEEYESYITTVNKMRAMLYQVTEKENVIVEMDSQNAFNRLNIESQNSNNEILNAHMIGNLAVFDTRCNEGPCFFVFNMSNVSGWKAYIDNQPVPISRTNFAFMGITVPEGTHQIWFEYSLLFPAISKIVSETAFCIVLFFLLIRSKINSKS